MSKQSRGNTALRERAGTAGSHKSFGSSADVESAAQASPMSPASSSLHAAASPRRRASSGGSSAAGGGRSVFCSAQRQRRIVNWIQDRKVPVLWRGSKKSDDAEASGRSLHHLHHGESSDRHVEHGPSLATSVYLVTGLDRVLFGTQSCADAVTVVGIKPPRYLWFMLSGGVCDVVQFATNVLLYWSAVLRDPSLIWAAGFLISIAFRHSSHRYLVFGDYVGGYWASLTRMYAGYSVIIVLSTAFNYVAARAAGPVVPVYAIWIATMLWTGLANYFILKKLWSFDGGFATSGKATSPTVTVAQ